MEKKIIIPVVILSVAATIGAIALYIRSDKRRSYHEPLSPYDEGATCDVPPVVEATE